jgi:hypothetical protein
VLVAAWVELSGISPGNSKGAWEVVPEPPIAPPEPVVPAEPFPDPVTVDDSADAPDADAACDPVDADDPDGVDDVGSEPTALEPLLVWPFVCSTVWPWAAVMPRNIITMMKTRCTALSRVECTALPRSCWTTRERRKTTMKFMKGPGRSRDRSVRKPVSHRHCNSRNRPDAARLSTRRFPGSRIQCGQCFKHVIDGHRAA